jgi:UDP-N-acetylmuramate dehydrogenase
VFPGKVIEEAGLKGLSVGGAQVSHKHANFIINKKDASADDVRLLIESVQRLVYEKSKIRLEREPLYLGEKN